MQYRAKIPLEIGIIMELRHFSTNITEIDVIVYPYFLS